jgi:DNA-binding CsgD family transcriptional regulator
MNTRQKVKQRNLLERPTDWDTEEPGSDTDDLSSQIQQWRGRSSEVMLRRLKKTEEQVEEERRNWLSLPDTDENRNLRYWAIKKKEAYAEAPRNALARQATLSDMQWYVAYWLSHGKDLKEIMAKLGVGIDRVNDLVSEIKRKAAVNSDTAIVRWFLGH